MSAGGYPNAGGGARGEHFAKRTTALKASTKRPVQKTFSLAASERFVVAWFD